MFNFNNSIKNFLSLKENNYIPQSESFKKFIYTEKKLNLDSDILTFFNGINSTKILEALDFYIVSNNISSNGSTQTYSSFIKEYFLYLMQLNIIANTHLSKEFSLKSNSKESYLYIISNFIENHPNIIDPKKFRIMNMDDVEDLLDICNSTIDEITINSINNNNISTNDFYKLRSALILKLISFIGVKYVVLKEIKENDLDLENNLIKVNSFNIRLPIKLSKQLKQFLFIKKIFINNIITDYLFIEPSGKKLKKVNTQTLLFLEKSSDCKNLNGLIKYAILNMIKLGVDTKIILNLTGIGEVMLNECLEIYSNENQYSLFSKILDSKLRLLEIYDKL